MTINLTDKWAWLAGMGGRPSKFGMSLRLTLCAWLGHSRIDTMFFGYAYCARCHEQIGDSLGGSYTSFANLRHLLNGTDEGPCETCEEHRPELTWKDWLLVWDYEIGDNDE